MSGMPLTLPLSHREGQLARISDGDDDRAVSEAPAERSARRLRRGLSTFFVLALLLLLAHALVFELFLVTGNSMDPTLKDEDRVLVLKHVDPKRGELVVFKNPNEPAQNIIKRVIALGGDTIEIRNGRVLVNGAELGEPYLVHPADRDGSLDMASLAVGPGKIFVLGDNRIVSQDSRRASFGPIDARHVIGRAVLALWPMRLL
jgi:signal peptidase I